VRASPRAAGQYLNPHLSEARTRQTWAKILTRCTVRRTDSAVIRWVVVPAAVLALGAGAFMVSRHPASPMVADGGLTIASGAEPRSFELAGAEIELQPFASVTVAPVKPFEQRLAVTRGAVRFRIVHDRGRRFVVVAGAVEVEDVGTVFTVALEGKGGELVRVSVAQGDVEVRVGSLPPRPLHAGESLTTPEPVSDASREPLSAAPVGTGVARPVSTPSTFEGMDATFEPEPVPAPPTSSPGATRSVDPASAKSLLAEATAARQTGDPSAEARALDTLRRRFPREPRAPIAGFELGIIRMDQLGDRRGALEALRAAIALSPGASFREDAEARIVTLLDELGEGAGCRASREAFQVRYPESVHRASIQSRCPSR
jgi:hypothetical protein